MQSKFKFGDHVRIRGSLSTCIFIKRTDDNDAFVVFESEDEAVKSGTLPMNHLELIPHPDTERLDWFEENVNLCQTLCSSDQSGELDCCWDLQSWDTGGNITYFATPENFYSTLRDVIDAAMQGDVIDAAMQEME